MKVHQSVTIDRVMRTAQENSTTLSNTGICVECGEEQEGCEPDARKYPCESCGKNAVYGAEELLFMMA